MTIPTFISYRVLQGLVVKQSIMFRVLGANRQSNSEVRSVAYFEINRLNHASCCMCNICQTETAICAYVRAGVSSVGIMKYRQQT